MKINKAIILPGGTRTRLKPVTSILNKHLINIYDGEYLRSILER